MKDESDGRKQTIAEKLVSAGGEAIVYDTGRPLPNPVTGPRGMPCLRSDDTLVIITMFGHAVNALTDLQG
ncbi:hypothetical protein [Candidatus Mycobacterium methanotrophicum]|uniref:Uncharacterized protein n=1 Tax=Candidatus Mycobacterium methanotrophicum TaxID=2943498 RepID=A0ABY4QI96_9MYCO|nr:hypothetical protein [Candidatus Mycobacterium methanotrophicum]UQX10752.1 hypothetical protein M5I08_22710 [Candidatus Mycobacterium methanotrophicum]